MTTRGWVEVVRGSRTEGAADRAASPARLRTGLARAATVGGIAAGRSGLPALSALSAPATADSRSLVGSTSLEPATGALDPVVRALEPVVRTLKPVTGALEPVTGVVTPALPGAPMAPGPGTTSGAPVTTIRPVLPAGTAVPAARVAAPPPTSGTGSAGSPQFPGSAAALPAQAVPALDLGSRSAVLPTGSGRPRAVFAEPSFSPD